MIYSAVTAFLGVSSRPTPDQAAAIFEGMILKAIAEGGLSELLQAECALISVALEKADRTDAAESHYAQAEGEITMLAQKVRRLTALVFSHQSSPVRLSSAFMCAMQRSTNWPTGTASMGLPASQSMAMASLPPTR